MYECVCPCDCICASVHVSLLLLLLLFISFALLIHRVQPFFKRYVWVCMRAFFFNVTLQAPQLATQNAKAQSIGTASTAATAWKKQQNNKNKRRGLNRAKHTRMKAKSRVSARGILHLSCMLMGIHTAQTKYIKGAAYFYRMNMNFEWKWWCWESKREEKRKKMPIDSCEVYACALKTVLCVCKKSCCLNAISFETHKVNTKRNEYGQFDAEWIENSQNKWQTREKKN